MAKKRRYFKKKAVLKAITNYHRTKLHYIFSIYWNSGTLTIDGTEQSAFSIRDAFQGNSNEYQNLNKQYAMVKLRGIGVEAVGGYQTTGYNLGVCLGQANDSVVFDNVKTQPNVMLLCNNIKTRMYCRISSQFVPTNDNQLFDNVKLIPFGQGSPSARFTIRVTLYLTFKTNL